MNLSRGKKSSLRVIAGFLAAIFLVQETVYGASAGSFVDNASPLLITNTSTGPTEILQGVFSNLNLPAELGKVSTVYSAGNSDKTVIHIQDLHINEGAQLKIAEIIDYVSTRYGIKLIQLEGASGELAHGPLSRYPVEKARSLAARSFLREGMITGAEYLAITKKPDLILYGVEDKELYKQNRVALTQAIELGEGLAPHLVTFKKNLQKLSGLVFPKKLKDLIESRSAFESNALNISTYAHTLKDICAAEKIKCETPQISRLFKIEFLEDQARREERFKSEEELSDYLAETLKQEGGIDSGIFLEIKETEKTLENRLITGVAPQKLYKLFRIMDVYEKMLTLSLNRENVEFLHENRADFAPQHINLELFDLSRRYRLDMQRDGKSFEKAGKALAAFEKFYKLAILRDETLVSGALNSLNQFRKNYSVLITGGFHTPAIEARFKKEGINFCTITPAITGKIDTQKDQRLYFKVMKLQKSPAAEFIGAQDPALQLQVESRLSVRRDLAALRGKLDLSRNIQIIPNLAHEIDMMLVMGAAGIRLLPKPTEIDLTTASHYLTPQEAPLFDIFRFLHRKETLVNSVLGTAFAPYDSELGFGVFYQSKPAAGWQEMQRSLREKSVSITTPDKKRTEIRIITDKAVSDLTQKHFKTATAKKVQQEIKKTEIAPKAEQTAPAKVKPTVPPAAGQTKPAKFKNAADRLLKILQKRASIKNVLAELRSELRCGIKDSTGPSVRDGESFEYDEDFLKNEGAETYPKNFFEPDESEPVYGRGKKKSGGLAQLFQWAGTNVASLLPQEAIKGIGASTFILSARGTQSYGGQLTLEDADGNTIFLFFKDVNPKRSVLYKRLLQDLEREIEKAKANGFRVIDGYSDYSSHLRFATGSVSTRKEAHPHLSPEDLVNHYSWKDSKKKIESKKRYVQVSVRHNGDEDGLEEILDIITEHPLFSFAKKMSKDEIRNEFNRINYPDSTKGDSPVIASLLAIFINQGRWDASARFAYLTLAGSLKEAFKDLTDPDDVKKVTKVWGDVFDEVFKLHLDKIFRDQNGKWLPDARYIDSTFLPALIAKIKSDSRIRNDKYLKNFSAEQLEEFTETALYAFLNQDTQRSIEILLATTQKTSTFGLSISYTLEPRTKFWVSKGQPAAIGYNPNTRRFIAASDPGAVWGSLNKKSHFLTLNEGDGEIVRLDMSRRNGVDGTRAPSLKIFSMAKHRDLTRAEIKSRWVPMGNNPYLDLPKLPEENENNLKTDIADLNDVMLKVDDSFAEKHRTETKKPSNRLTADNFNKAILEIAAARRLQTAKKNEDAAEAKAAKKREWEHEVELWRQHAVREKQTPYFLILTQEKDREFAQGKADSITKKIPGAQIKIVTDKEFSKNEEVYEAELKRAKERGLYTQVLPVRENTASMDFVNAISKAIQFPASFLIWGEEPQFNEHDVEEADLVFVAEGPSYYLAKRKMEDLKPFLPGLKIEVIRGNDYMTQLDSYYSGNGVPFKLGPNSLLFAISESGMTFSEAFTGQHAQMMKEEGKLKDVFVMTGEWFSILGRTTGQQYFPDSKFDGHIFSNMSGRRYAEASTMASATEFFLSKMFLDLFKTLAIHGPENSGEPRPFGMKLTDKTIRQLESQLDSLIKTAGGHPSPLSVITGTGAGGVAVESETNQKLLAEGQNRANHLSENYIISDALVGLTRLYGVVSGVLHMGIFTFLAFVFTILGLWITGFEHLFNIIQNFPALEIAGLAVIFGIARIFDIILATWPDKIFMYVLRVLQNRDTNHRYGVPLFLAIGGSHSDLLRDYNRNALLEAQAGLQFASIEAQEKPGDFMHHFKDPTRKTAIDVAFSDDSNSTDPQERNVAGWKMTMSQSNGVQSLGGGPDILVTTTDPESSYKFSHLDTGEAQNLPKEDTDNAFRILHARWVDDLKLLVAGQVRAAEMADALARARFPFFVRRSDAWHQYLLEALFQPLSWLYSKYALYMNAKMMEKMFRAVPDFEFLFTPGKGLSGAKVFSTQTIPPTEKKRASAAPRDKAKIAVLLAKHGVGETTWIPKPNKEGKPSLMSRIMAELYNPVDERPPGPGNLTGHQAAELAALVNGDTLENSNGHSTTSGQKVVRQGWSYTKIPVAEAGPVAVGAEVIEVIKDGGWSYKKMGSPDEGNGEARSEMRAGSSRKSLLKAALRHQGMQGKVKVKLLKSEKDFFDVFLVNLKGSEKPVRIVIFKNAAEKRSPHFKRYQAESFNYDWHGTTYRAFALRPEVDIFLDKVISFQGPLKTETPGTADVTSLSRQYEQLEKEAKTLKARASVWPKMIDIKLNQVKDHIQWLKKMAGEATRNLQIFLARLKKNLPAGNLGQQEAALNASIELFNQYFISTGKKFPDLEATILSFQSGIRTPAREIYKILLERQQKLDETKTLFEEETRKIQKEIEALETRKINPGFSEYPYFETAFLELKKRAEKAALTASLPTAIKAGLARLHEKSESIKGKIEGLELNFSTWKTLLASIGGIKELTQARKKLAEVTHVLQSLKTSLTKYYGPGKNVWDYLYPSLREQILHIEGEITRTGAELLKKEEIRRRTELKRREILARASAAGIFIEEIKGMNLRQALALVESREELRLEAAQTTRLFEDEISKAAKMNALMEIQDRVLRSSLLSEAKLSLLKKIKDRERALRKNFPIKPASSTPALEDENEKALQALEAAAIKEEKVLRELEAERQEEISREKIQREKTLAAEQAIRDRDYELALQEIKEPALQVEGSQTEDLQAEIERQKDEAYLARHLTLQETEAKESLLLEELQMEANLDLEDGKTDKGATLKAGRIHKIKKKRLVDEPKRKGGKSVISAATQLAEIEKQDALEKELKAKEEVMTAKLQRRQAAELEATIERQKSDAFDQHILEKEKIAREEAAGLDELQIEADSEGGRTVKAGPLFEKAKRNPKRKKNKLSIEETQKHRSFTLGSSVREILEELETDRAQKEETLLRKTVAERKAAARERIQLEKTLAAAKAVRDSDYELALKEIEQPLPQVEDLKARIERQKDDSFLTHLFALQQAGLKESQELDELQIEMSSEGEPVKAGALAEKDKRKRKFKKIKFSGEPTSKRTDISPLPSVRSILKELEADGAEHGEILLRETVAEKKAALRQAAQERIERAKSIAAGQEAWNKDYELALQEMTGPTFEIKGPKTEDLQAEIDRQKDAAYLTHLSTLQEAEVKESLLLDELQIEADLEGSKTIEGAAVKPERPWKRKQTKLSNKPKRKNGKPAIPAHAELTEIEKQDTLDQELAAKQKIIASKLERRQAAEKKQSVKNPSETKQVREDDYDLALKEIAQPMLPVEDLREKIEKQKDNAFLAHRAALQETERKATQELEELQIEAGFEDDKTELNTALSPGRKLKPKNLRLDSWPKRKDRKPVIAARTELVEIKKQNTLDQELEAKQKAIKANLGRKQVVAAQLASLFHEEIVKASKMNTLMKIQARVLSSPLVSEVKSSLLKQIREKEQALRKNIPVKTFQPNTNLLESENEKAIEALEAAEQKERTLLRELEIERQKEMAAEKVRAADYELAMAEDAQSLPLAEDLQEKIKVQKNAAFDQHIFDNQKIAREEAEGLDELQTEADAEGGQAVKAGPLFEKDKRNQRRKQNRPLDGPTRKRIDRSPALSVRDTLTELEADDTAREEMLLRKTIAEKKSAGRQAALEKLHREKKDRDYGLALQETEETKLSIEDVKKEDMQAEIDRQKDASYLAHQFALQEAALKENQGLAELQNEANLEDGKTVQGPTLKPERKQKRKKISFREEPKLKGRKPVLSHQSALKEFQKDATREDETQLRKTVAEKKAARIENAKNLAENSAKTGPVGSEILNPAGALAPASSPGPAPLFLIPPAIEKTALSGPNGAGSETSSIWLEGWLFGPTTRTSPRGAALRLEALESRMALSTFNFTEPQDPVKKEFSGPEISHTVVEQAPVQRVFYQTLDSAHTALAADEAGLETERDQALLSLFSDAPTKSKLAQVLSETLLFDPFPLDNPAASHLITDTIFSEHSGRRHDSAAETNGTEIVTRDSEGLFVTQITIEYSAGGNSYELLLSDFKLDGQGNPIEFSVIEKQNGVYLSLASGKFERDPYGELKGMVRDENGALRMEFTFKTTAQAPHSPFGVVTEVIVTSKDGSRLKVKIDPEKNISYQNEAGEAEGENDRPEFSSQSVPSSAQALSFAPDNSSTPTPGEPIKPIEENDDAEDEDSDEGSWGPTPASVLDQFFKNLGAPAPETDEINPPAFWEEIFREIPPFNIFEPVKHNSDSATADAVISDESAPELPATAGTLDWLDIAAIGTIAAGGTYYLVNRRKSKKNEAAENFGVDYAVRSEVRSMPHVEVNQNGHGKILTLILPPETGLGIRNETGEQVDQLLFHEKEENLYETDDKSMTATADPVTGNYIIKKVNGHGHSMVDINDNGLISELTVPPRPSYPPKVSSNGYHAPAEEETPDISTNSGVLFFKLALAGLFIATAAFSFWWFVPGLKLMTLPAATAWLQNNSVLLLYWAGTLVPPAVILWIFSANPEEGKDEDKTDRISWIAWTGLQLSRLILLAAFFGAGNLLLYFETAPLVFLTGFLWFIHGLFFIGLAIPQTTAWLLTVLSFPFRVIPWFAAQTTIKQNITAFFGLAVLFSALYLGVCASNRLSETPDTRLAKITAELTAEPLPGNPAKGKEPKDDKRPIDETPFEHKGKVETFIFDHAVPLLAHRSGQMSVDPASKINPVEWQKSNKAFPAIAGKELLILEQEKDQKATEMDELSKSIHAVNESLKILEKNGVMPRAEGFFNTAGPLLIKISNYEGRQGERVYKKRRVPGRDGEAVIFIPEKNDRPLGTVVPTTVLGRSQPVRHLGFKTVIPAGKWRTHDLLRMQAWVTLEGKNEVPARVINLEMDPLFNQHMNLTVLLESRSGEPIFGWNFKDNRPIDASFRLVIPRRQKIILPGDRLDQLPASSLVQGYAVAGKHLRLPVHAPENIGNWGLMPELIEGGWVRSRQPAIGMIERDRALLSSVLSESAQYEQGAEIHLRSIIKLINQRAAGAKAPLVLRESREIAKNLIEIRALREKWKHLNSLAPLDGYLTDAYKLAEGQPGSGTVAWVIAPQILIPVEYEKRPGIDVKIGEFVKLSRPGGEFAFGRILRVENQVSNNGGREPGRYGLMIIQTHNIPPHVRTFDGKEEINPGFWIVDNEPEIEVIYPPSASTSTAWAASNFLPLLHANPWQQLGALAATKVNPSPQQWMAQQYERQEKYLEALQKGSLNMRPLPLFPVEFTEPPANPKDLQRIREALRGSSFAPAPVTPRKLPAEVIREQQGENDAHLATTKNETILKIIRSSHGKNRQDWMKHFVENKGIPMGEKIEEIEQVVLYGPADAGQIGLDYLFDKHQPTALLQLHAALSKKSNQYDMTKRAGLHLVKSIETDKETLDHFARIKKSEPESLEAKAAQKLLASILALPDAATDRRSADATREILNSKFWHTEGDKFQLARALRNVPKDDPLYERRQKAAMLVESKIFAELFSRTGLSHQTPELSRLARFDTWLAGKFGLPGNWERYHGIKDSHHEDHLFGHSHRAVGYFLPQNIKGIINPKIYDMALSEFKTLKADAEKQPLPTLTLFDLAPQNAGLFSDHVFNSKDLSKQEDDYLPHLSLQGRELFLNTAENRPWDTRYRDGRVLVYDSLKENKSPESRLILARRFLSIKDPEEMKLLSDLKIDDLLHRELLRLKETSGDHEPVSILIFEQALAKYSGSMEFSEGKRRQALRRLLDTHTVYELFQVSHGIHLTTNALLKNVGVDEKVVRSTARQLLSRRAAEWAIDKTAEWNRDLSIQHQRLTPDSPLFRLKKSYELDNLDPKRVGAEWQRLRRDHPLVFERVLELYEFRFRELTKGETQGKNSNEIILVENGQIVPRDEVTRLEEWRLTLLFILGLPAFAFGLGWGIVLLTRPEPLTGKPRSEMRSQTKTTTLDQITKKGPILFGNENYALKRLPGSAPDSELWLYAVIPISATRYIPAGGSSTGPTMATVIETRLAKSGFSKSEYHFYLDRINGAVSFGDGSAPSAGFIVHLYLKQNSEKKSEMRSLSDALDAKNEILQSMRLKREFSFVTYERRARQQNLNFDKIIGNVAKAASAGIPNSGKGLLSGEIILNYRSQNAPKDSAKQWVEFMNKRRSVRLLSIVPDPETEAEDWKKFKDSVRAAKGFDSRRIVFADENGITNLEGLTNSRLKARRLSKETLFQVLEPAKIRKQELGTHAKLLRELAELGKETILVLGATEAIVGVRHKTIGEVIDEAFSYAKMIEVSA